MADPYGSEPDGAVLVRPDGFIGAHWRTAPANATADLAQALAGLARHRS